MTPEEIKDVLEKHKRWLQESKGWSEDDRANLRGANLYEADLYRANLRRADLYRANLYGANLYGANLRGADLRGADLYRANLYGANLRRADLYRANLRGAELYGADLRGANLYEADLRGADLYRANLYGANLRRADLYRANLRGAELYEADLYRANLREADLRRADLRGAKNIPLIPYACPDTGSFIGYKRAREDKIVELEILSDARRLSATGRKCRCDKAKVLSIKSIDGSETFERATSIHDSDFVYKVGEIVEVSDFDEDRWNECSAGIHFFINRQEAVEYNI